MKMTTSSLAFEAAIRETHPEICSEMLALAGSIVATGLSTQIPTAFDPLHIEAFGWNSMMSVI